MKKISIVINLDTRKGLFDNETSSDIMFKGTRSIDFLTEGVRNKYLFFKDFSTEIIVFIDQHEQLPDDMKAALFKAMDFNIIHSLVFSKHRTYFDACEYYPKWNDINYLQALTLARGEYIAHFDGDMAAFINDPSIILEWISWIDSGKYKYISYPSLFSPLPVVDPDFDDYTWVSTRFFFCKRDSIKPEEIIKCLSDSNYLYGKYGEKKRRCPWLEHVLGIMENKELIYYPPIELERYAIFAWNYYTRGLFERLNKAPYEEAKTFIQQRGISFPCDVRGDF